MTVTSSDTTSPILSRLAILFARIVFAWAFGYGAYGKFVDINATAGFIASIGFPLPLASAWLAAFLELGLALAFLTGAFFREAAIIATLYVLFLTFAFHGPSTWGPDQIGFGFFVDHFIFMAGLLYAAVFGAGGWLTLPWRVLPTRVAGR